MPSCNDLNLKPKFNLYFYLLNLVTQGIFGNGLPIILPVTTGRWDVCVLLTSSGQRPDMLLNILQCTPNHPAHNVSNAKELFKDAGTCPTNALPNVLVKGASFRPSQRDLVWT